MKTAGKNKSVELKPLLRVRVACKGCWERASKNGEAQTWLRRLYVLWAAPQFVEGASATFSLAQTDDAGYLSPVLNSLDPQPRLTLPLFVGAEYLFYFVRYPTAAMAREVLSLLEEDADLAKQTFGEPHSLTPILGKATREGGGMVTEGVIEVPETAAAFIQDGSDFYGGWCLYRDMPGMGANLKNTDVQCEELGRQVRRLQFHLGRMRYPIGNQWHPYSPEPWLTNKERANRKLPLPPGMLYPNEGIFDIVTWNCVLAFQRDAVAGKGSKLADRTIRPTLSEGSFDPLPAAEDRVLEMTESRKFVATEEGGGGGQVDIDLPERGTIVDGATGDAIKRWLKEGLRKPGAILVSRGNDIESFDSWMRDDVFDAVAALHADLIRLGCVAGDGLRRKNGVQFACSLRDVRMSVFEATKEPGHAVKSIHKSGYAFDMRMVDYAGPSQDAPLYYVPVDPNGKPMKWTVYAPVKESRIPAERDPYVEYEEVITPWRYDALSKTGGEVGDELRIDGCRFLNFTKVCLRHGFTPISAWSKGWQCSAPIEITIRDQKSFQTFVARLAADLELAANELLTRQRAEVVLGGKRFDAKSLSGMSKWLSKWHQRMGRYLPQPEVRVEPWTKGGRLAVGLLQGKDFAGLPARIRLFLPPEGTPEGEGNGEEVLAEEDVELGSWLMLPAKNLPIEVLPNPGPVLLEKGIACVLPGLGMAQAQEWWHFNYLAGYAKVSPDDPKVALQRKTWGVLLGEIGWTREGLLGARRVQQKGTKRIVLEPYEGVHGQWGLGYLPAHLDSEAV